MVEACLAAFGRIDVLVNNVGIARPGGIVDTAEPDWDLVTEVNLKSVYLVCRAVVPVMERQRKGAIVNIASVAAHRWTGINYASYYATKGARRGAVARDRARVRGQGHPLQLGLARPDEHADGPPRPDRRLRREGDVENLVKVRDAQCPMGHMGTGWDTAHACLFLASDEAKYITAHDLVVDGGLIAKFA